jgi:hypothetical protein
VFKISDKQIGQIKISTSDFIEDTMHGGGSGVGIELYSDIAAGFRFTKVSLEFKNPAPLLDLSRTTELYEPNVLAAVNAFLNAYRYITGRHKIRNIVDINSLREYVVSKIDQGREKLHLVSGLPGYKGDTLSPFRPLRTDEEHVSIQNTINKGPNLEDIFIMDARRQFGFGHFVEALILSVVALEISVVYPVEKKKFIERMLKWFFPYRQLEKYLITRLKSRSYVKSDLELTIGAIRERNKIVHSGKRKITESQTKKYIDSIFNIITALKS